MRRSTTVTHGVALGVALSLGIATFGCGEDASSEPTASENGLSPSTPNAGATTATGGSGATAAPSASEGSTPAANTPGRDAPATPTAIDPGSDTSEGAAPSANAADAGATEAPEVADAGASPPPPGFRPCPTDGSPCRIMPLGDSITDGLVGVGVGNTQPSNGGYRVELFRQALADGHDITFVGTSPRGANGPAQVDGQPFPRDHEGISGDTIPGVAGRIDAAIAATTPDIILLQIGTNHLYTGLAADIPGQLANLVDQITNDAPDALLVVAQVTPLGAMFANNGVAAYNAGIPAMVQQRADAGKHVIVVDNFTPIASNPAGVAGLVGDNIHPNVNGYAILAGSWYGAIESYLP